jgi:lipopolysaccharide export system protein LptC
MSSRIKAGPASAAEKLARQANFRVKVSTYLGLGAVALGFFVLLAFLIQSGFFSNFLPHPVIAPETLENATVISGTESHISGLDKENLPYEIAAKKGVQDKASDHLVHLQTVTGVFHRPNNKLVNLNSNSAIYDAKTKAMTLDGDVVFEEPGRYTARMQKASMNLDDKSLVSESPVHVDMANGTVEADSLEISDSGKRSLFKGRVKAVFEGTKNGEAE